MYQVWRNIDKQCDLYPVDKFSLSWPDVTMTIDLWHDLDIKNQYESFSHDPYWVYQVWRFVACILLTRFSIITGCDNDIWPCYYHYLCHMTLKINRGKLSLKCIKYQNVCLKTLASCWEDFVTQTLNINTHKQSAIKYVFSTL